MTDHRLQDERTILGNTEGPALETLLTTKRQLEREREGMLEQAAVRLRAIGQINSVIATLRGLQDDSAMTTTSAPAIVARRRNKLDPSLLREWVLEFALVQTRAFSTGDIGRWMLESGKLPEGTNWKGAFTNRIAEVLMNDGRFQMQGSGPQRRFARRQTIAVA